MTLETASLQGGGKIKAHSKADCTPPCPIHAPSDHHMRAFRQVFRFDRNLMERICPHGIGHPDPDDINVRMGHNSGVHGCDGCCAAPGPVES